jgi:LPS-assembly lipoprotein
VKYVLTDIASGRPLTRGTSESTTIFNIVESEFANLNAQSDARARAVIQISDDIRLRLGLFFRKRPASQGS